MSRSQAGDLLKAGDTRIIMMLDAADAADARFLLLLLLAFQQPVAKETLGEV